MSFVVEPESPRDFAAIRDVVRAAFASHPEVADLPGLIRASPHHRPELALVARADRRIVGFVMVSGAHVVSSDGTRHDVLTLSPLAVAPEQQGRGIGSTLVRAAIDAADAAGEGLVALEGSPRYYGRLGFTYAPDSGISIMLPDWAPAEAARVYRLRAYDPTVRGRLVYPPAFAAVGTGQ